MISLIVGKKRKKSATSLVRIVHSKKAIIESNHEFDEDQQECVGLQCYNFGS